MRTAAHRNRVASTGNDIVALIATDKERTSRSRFYSRILSAEEQTLYRQQWSPEELPFDHYVWLMWSIKESVYKYSSRIDREPVFSPLKIPVHRLDPPSGDEFYKGITGYGPGTLYSRSIIRDGAIVTAVSGDEDFEDTRWGFTVIGSSNYADQSMAVRTLALNKLQAVFPRRGLRIEKACSGFPVLLEGKTPLDIPLSLAHHDRYVAYSFRLPSNSSSYKKSAAN
jgi:hypothetical protein